ncbi:hypothetical protein DFH28DRAFT_919834 [Melampsora americana]|nr:hypothetical protein DFH28DRAFT_919834 [Melampsora americana]
MSTPNQTCVFLPTYILEYVVNEVSPRIDSDLFLRKATPEQLLEVIVAFYPHFKFTKKAKEDYELLQMTFTKMVAFRLSTSVAPIKSDTTYFQIQLNNRPGKPEESIKVVDSKDDINSERVEVFNSFCFSYIKNHQFRIAARNLARFTDTYQFLNQEEIEQIARARPDTECFIKKSLVDLTQTYELVETIQLEILDCSFQTIQHKELDDQLNMLMKELTLKQEEFSRLVEDGALIAAIIQYHQ